ncbi:hypothetical protein GQ43DRAFT_372212 [Delitschia confertaspora ATCC 74209]|uniref:Nitrogen regulatory protein areA GATA-like domain-containing protein n=1 Tax=Delitschia confertaspora ATCC 74209 TaxID=1513339 RepID=A0A9P4MPV0_9PLEO|nr:hypothetical protein GQ43DRAFT_372212 [Delitschia confertaspora ATCC 74209]
MELPNAPLRRSATSHTSFFVDAPSNHFASGRKNNYSYSDLRSASNSSRDSSVRSTPASSLDLTTGMDEHDDREAFPIYAMDHLSVDEGRISSSKLTKSISRPPPSPTEEAVSPTTFIPDPLLISEDDTAVRREPSQHVDYLSYDWKDEDIWSSWRHIVSQRKVYGQRSRLENASWRTWAKSQFGLRTVSPETLNWLKDGDVTWLYGPLQPASNRISSKHTSEPVSRLSKSNSFLHHKKPILKKRSMSEVMLQKSISASSLVKQAAAAVQAQQANGILLDRRRGRIPMGRAASDFASSIPSQTISRDPMDFFSSRSTSGLHTPDHGERKHIRFDDKVEQCIAVECKDGYDDDDTPAWALHDDSDSSDDGVVMMKKSNKRRPLFRTHSKSSFSGESKTIAKLPSTTLKYRTDSPDVTEQSSKHPSGIWQLSGLSPSPSQETLRPSNPSANFLLAEDEDSDDDDLLWEPSRVFDGHQDTIDDLGTDQSDSSPDKSTSGLRRTASGMIMPPHEDDDEHPVPAGLMGRVVDTVHTARDIAHVIWNVGWRGS